MNNYVTIKIFTYPYGLGIIRTYLESEGIECRVQDEITVQVDPLLSNAIGGVKLQVKESDVEKAMELLREGGYLNDEILRPSKFYRRFDRATSKIPIIKNLRIEFRLLVVVGIISALLLVIILALGS